METPYVRHLYILHTCLNRRILPFCVLLKGSFESSLKDIPFTIWKNINRNLFFKIKKNTDIFTLFGFKGIYLIKINDFRKWVSANIHMFIKDGGYRSWRNMISSGNGSKCLIEIFQILQNIMYSKDRYFLRFEDKRIEFIIGLSTT